ncbi:MAG: hypothetical protein CME64_04255 [Halobacteriovoraceae bacterium]|nr:hypothetical protein [Halobacteriovoraceae bacterium]
MNFAKYCLITSLVISFNLFAHSQSISEKAWKMTATIQAESFHKTLKNLSLMNIDIAGVDIKKKSIDILITDQEYKFLSKKNYVMTVKEVRGVTRGPDERYQTPESVRSYLQKYNQKFPKLTKLVSIGKSLEGRDIWALKISDNAQKKELDEPVLLFNSMHHAREIMTPEIGLDIIQYLLENYETDAQVARWVDLNEIWVMPMFNVDGNVKMWTKDSWWRKNVRGGHGVDLNRNYPTGWKSCQGSSGWRWSQTYRGPSPASEPETQAMMKFIEDIRPVFDISYHAYSQLVIYPFGCEGQKTQTKEVVEKIGKELASLLDYTPGTAWETLYNADGGDIDWMYEAYQVIPYVLEVNSSRDGFHPDYERRDPTVKRNRKGWQHLLNRAHGSGVRGVFSINNKAVAAYKLAVYKVNGEVRELFQNYVGHKTGAYHLVLNPGSYELDFIVDGKTVTSRTVEIQDELSRMNVNLTK